MACGGEEPAVEPEPPVAVQDTEPTPPETPDEPPAPAPLPSTPPNDGAAVLEVPGSQGRAPVNQILFKLTGGAANRAEAERVAASVEGELVAHLESAGLYTIRVPTETMQELGERMARVESDDAVETVMHNWVADLY